jgi:hypothetical protein
VERLLKELDSDDFTTREEASKVCCAWASRWSRARAADGEPRRRLGGGWRRCGALDPSVNGERLRDLRAVEALRGRHGGARQVLERLATGDPAARFTRDGRRRWDAWQSTRRSRENP